MTQENRTPVHIDISPKERVTAVNDARVTSTNWDPARGAREAQARIEEAIKQQWIEDQQRIEQDPVNVRFTHLEQQVRELHKVIGQLQDDMLQLQSIYGGK